MKKVSKQRNLLFCGLLAAAVAAPASASADLLADEVFDYPLGSLYTSPAQGGWLETGTNSTGSITVVNSPLSLAGYHDGPAGNAMYMANGKYQSLVKTISDSPLTSGKYYAAFLINVSEAPTEKYQLAGFGGKNFNGWVDGKAAASVIGKLFLAPATGGFSIGYSKNGAVATSTYGSEAYALNTTHLVVMSYEFVDGSTNDIFNVWVNPTADSEGSPVYTQSNTADFSATNGMQGVRFYMGKSTGAGASLTIDALRVATSWDDLFSGNGGGEVTPPVGGATIKATPAAITCAPEGYMFVGQKAAYTVTVKGENLSEAISVSTSMPGLTAAVSSISVSEAEAGYELQLTYTAPATAADGNVTLTSAGADPVVISLKAPEMVVEATDYANCLSLKNAEPYSYTRYTGSMGRVTFVDEANKAIYFEDMSGAIKINYFTDQSPLAVGDKVRNLFLMPEEDEACFSALTPAIGEISATESYKSPSEVSFADIRSDLSSYLYRLVKVSDVTFTNVPSGAVWGTANVEASDEFGTGRVRAFAGTDLAEVAVPASATSVTGISTSKALPVVTMRSAADFAQPDPELTVTPELLINASEYQTIGNRVEYGRFTVSAVNMPKISIWMSGAGASQYELSTEEIPAGTASATVTVWYNPTKTGEHKANLVFESSITEQNAGFTLTARAYDPANPPVLTAETEALVPFVAEVGQTQTQTFSYTAKGLLAYGKAAIEAPASGQFQLSSTMLMKDGTYNITVTFRPQAEGTFTDKVVLSADMAESVEFTITGSTTGTVDPEKPQGDELAYDTSVAYAQYSTDFTTAIANNQPISLEGWKNCATVGTRAWWSYELESGHAAKATLYDSKASDDDYAQMFLLSPALSFKNAAEHLLCFDIMGQNMSDGQDGILNVVYVDPSDPDDVYIEAIGGLAIPCTSDENGQWAHYVIDTKAWDLPETFFIGFLYEGSRGRNNSTMYYVDNFSWGLTDVPFIRTSHQTVTSSAVAGHVHTTPEVTVTGLNLTEPISLALAGEHAKNFTLSTTELPAEGGQFSLDFVSDDEADHNAWVTLRSGSAAQSVIGFTVANKATDAIASPVASIDPETTVSVFDTMGRVVLLDVKAHDAIGHMQNHRGTLFIVRPASGPAIRYMAK